jgi:hypothetical protein
MTVLNVVQLAQLAGSRLPSALTERPRVVVDQMVVRHVLLRGTCIDQAECVPMRGGICTAEGCGERCCGATRALL